MLKIWDVSIVDENSEVRSPGEVISASENKGFVVQAGKGTIEIKTLQLAGKKRMDSASFLRGYNLDQGSVLG